MKVQEGKFKLQDLLVVPMQRVLKYHLLLKVGPRVVKRNVLREIMEALCYKMNSEHAGVLRLHSFLTSSCPVMD